MSPSKDAARVARVYCITSDPSVKSRIELAARNESNCPKHRAENARIKYHFKQQKVGYVLDLTIFQLLQRVVSGKCHEEFGTIAV